MIGFIKKAVNRAAKKKTVVFEGFVALASGVDGGVFQSKLLHAKNMVNCDTSGGVLKQGVGAQVFTTAAGNTIAITAGVTVKGIISARFRGEDGGAVERFLVTYNYEYTNLYGEEEGKFVTGTQTGKDGRAAFLRAESGEERLFIAGSKGSRYLLADGRFASTGLSNTTGALCVCKNRLFTAQKGGKLIYSDPKTPWDFAESIDDGGYIKLPLEYGDPIVLTAVGEYVYVFFKNAIMRVRVRGSGREFCVDEIPYDGAQIVGETVCPFSDGIIWAAYDGLWLVKGARVERFCKELRVNLSANNPDCNAAVCTGKYFLRYQDWQGAYHSLAVDADGKSWSDYYDLHGITKTGDKVLFVRENKIYQLGDSAMPAGEQSRFDSVDLDFGMQGKKTLRALEFSGEGSFVLGVHCDGKYVEREVVFSGGKAVVKLDTRGETFAFSFTMAENSALRAMRVEIAA